MLLRAAGCSAICNPHSCGGDYRRDVPLIVDALRGFGYTVDERQTQRRRATPSRFARQAVERGLRRRLRVGGDGTVNEIINGLAGSDVPLAIVPTGTVNVLAMELGIPLEPPDAVRVIENGLRRRGSTSAWPGSATSRSWPASAWTRPSSPR